MSQVSKELLLSDLKDMLEIMNKESFWMHIRKKHKVNRTQRTGRKIEQSILKRNEADKIEDLTRDQLEYEIELIYRKTVRFQHDH